MSPFLASRDRQGAVKLFLASCDAAPIGVGINGTKVNHAYDVFPTSGKVLLQCEGFELFVRTFELHPLKK